MVPVDADRTLPRASTNVQLQYVRLRCVFFVVLVAGVHQELVAGKALRPVTLFTGFTRRAEVLYRRRNGARIVVERYHENLPRTGNLRPHKPPRSGPDMA